MDTDDCESGVSITDSDFYRMLVEHTSVGTVTVDAANRIVDVNAALESLLGYTADELVGDRLESIVAEQARPLEETAAFAASEDQPTAAELTFVHRDGTAVPKVVDVVAFEYRNEPTRTAFVCPRSESIERTDAPSNDEDGETVDTSPDGREGLESADADDGNVDVDRLFRTVATEILESSTREGIEQTVCDRLAESHAYEFAWVAEVDRTTDEVTPRATADAEEYLSAIDLTTDPTEPTGQGPGGKTFRTGETHVSRDVFEDPSFEPWREHADRFGFRSVATVPITTEATLYGAMGIYSARVDAFDDTEREVVDQLGRLVGDAIASAAQREALSTDSVVELEFRSRDVFESIDPPVAADGPITLEHVVALGDERYLAYGGATAESLTALEAAADGTLGCIESVTRGDESGDSSRFEMRLHDPPLVPELMAHGATLERAHLADGDLTIQIAAVPGGSVHPVVDAVTTSCPGAEMVSRRQRPQRTDTPEQIRRSLTDRLTERQQTTLEAAYHAGFFEWPRERSGEEVAASLEINSSTFHQHVRKAENTLLDVLFGGE